MTYVERLGRRATKAVEDYVQRGGGNGGLERRVVWWDFSERKVRVEQRRDAALGDNSLASGVLGRYVPAKTVIYHCPDSSTAFGALASLQE